ncbi:MAG: sensor domain-containing protein [Candidatus Krumholzibacteria bacterium]|nr:sensor domain-containing protein [Candidatus Krumholzibacteria bacterium]
MNKAIDDYLVKLKTALAGADRATIQDALSDAEEHLATALEQALDTEPGLDAETALGRIIETYGAPAEVAAAYKEMENMTPNALAIPGPGIVKPRGNGFFGVLGDIRTYGALLYMLLSLATGIFYFTWATTALSLSAGFIVLIIGLPFVAAFLLSVRGIALIEGRIIEGVLGERMPRHVAFFRKDLGWWGGFKALIGDRTIWSAILYMILQLPLGILYFTITITLIALSLGLIVMPILHYIFNFPFVQTDHHAYYLPGWSMPLVVMGGFFLMIVTLHVARGLGHLHARYAKKLLVKGD